MNSSVVLERLPAGDASQSPAAAGQPRRQRVYIFLTRHGLIFGVILMVMLIGAVNYTNSLAYALTFLLSSLFLVAMLHTYSNLRGLIINSSVPEPVFAGEQARFPLVFDNRPGAARLALELQTRVKPGKGFRRKARYLDGSCVDIDAHTIQPRFITMPAEKRGHLVPGRIKISSTWPIGLFRAWSYMQIDQHCVVYPRPHGTVSLPITAVVDEEEMQGKGIGTDDFIGFRQYQSGDSMRAVDWKAYARERGLVSKRFSGRGTRKILVDWQQTGHIDDIEARLSQLCLWVLEADKQRARYALLLPGHRDTRFDSGEEHKQRCLEALAGYGLDNDHAR